MTEMQEVLDWLNGKIEEVDDPEAVEAYEQAENQLHYGLQAEYLEKDSERYDF
jgi:hypothetical protein